MFSGIIEEIGSISGISRQQGLLVLEISTAKVFGDTKIGDSICVNGVCLTVIGLRENKIKFEVIPETLRATNLSELNFGDVVNLERSLKIGDRLSGHFVTGHVDCTGIIRRKYYREGSYSFEIAVPESFNNYFVDRGSIAVDGISLTIAKKANRVFIINIIPHTFKNTNLSYKKISQKVNVEFDILLKKP